VRHVWGVLEKLEWDVFVVHNLLVLLDRADIDQDKSAKILIVPVAEQVLAGQSFSYNSLLFLWQKKDVMSKALLLD
jgi:hypothetical protein